MSDFTRPHLEERMDRYVRRELTIAEARELAQKSLDDQELFEHLTYSAVANAGLETPGAKVLRFPWRARNWVAAAAAGHRSRCAVFRAFGSAPCRTDPRNSSSRSPDRGARGFRETRPADSSGERTRTPAGTSGGSCTAVPR